MPVMPTAPGRKHFLLPLLLLSMAVAELPSPGKADLWILGDTSAEVAELSERVTTIRLRTPDLSNAPLVRGLALFTRNMQQRATGLRILIETPSTAPPGEGELVVAVELDAGLPAESHSLTIVQIEGGGVAGEIRAADALGVAAALGELVRQSLPGGGEAGIRFSLRGEATLQAPRFAIRNAFGPIGAHGDAGAAQRTGSTGWPSVPVRDDYFASAILHGNNILLDGMGSNQRVSLAQVAATGYNNSWHAYSTLAANYDAQYCLAIMANALNPDDRVSNESDVVWPFTHSAFARLGCPSDPATRTVMLRERELYFQNAPRIDWALVMAGDIAGCRCEDCVPWGETYLDFSKEMARDLTAAHPNARFLVNNTWLSPAEDAVFLAELAGMPTDLIAGYVYAPGSDEGSTYGFMPGLAEWQTPRDPLPPEAHPADAPLIQRAFFRSVQALLGPSGLVTPEYIDITHWKSAQYGMEDQSHPMWLELHLRRSYMPRPRAYTAIIRASLALQPPEGGMMAYSEGVHDDLHKFLLSRLLSDPDEHSTAELVRHYYELYAGPAAAAPLTGATLAMEEWHRTAPGTEGLLEEVQATRAAIEEAVAHIPAPMRPGQDPAGWRVQLLRERAALDLYALMKFDHQHALHRGALATLGDLVDSTPLDRDALRDLVTSARGELHRETPAMEQLREEIGTLDDALNAAIGLRFDTFSRLDVIDTAGLAWLAGEIEASLTAGNETQIRARLRRIINHETVSDGEIWANLGTEEGNRHLLHPGSVRHYYGEGDDSLRERPSRRSYIYTHEAIRSVELRFEGLDSGRDYALTITHPNPSPRFYSKDSANSYDVLAGPGGINVGRVTPAGAGPRDFPFVIPSSAIDTEGRLEIELRAVPGQCRSISISELRLTKQ